MLQQTVVSAVIPHFRRWMGEFPDVKALAVAPADAVLRAWAGLGYYARARNLHQAAKTLVARGAWPRTAEEWREIPGVGEYTSGAVASLALGQRAPILDGNIVRVFSRLLGLGFLPGAGAAEKRAYWDLARQWVGEDVEGAAPGEPGALNEALMELGALVCVPGVPRCGSCPLAAVCTARRAGLQAELPPVKPRAKPAVVPAVAVVARYRGRVLTERRAAGAFLAGHHMFPLFLEEEAQAARWRAAGVFGRRFPGWEIVTAASAGRIRHAIMSKRYDAEVWVATLRPTKTRASSRAPTSEGMHWISIAEVDASLTNSLARKIWTIAGSTKNSKS
jgi:A/G-specific adenine glycosylase